MNGGQLHDLNAASASCRKPVGVLRVGHNCVRVSVSHPGGGAKRRVKLVEAVGVVGGAQGREEVVSARVASSTRVRLARVHPDDLHAAVCARVLRGDVGVRTGLAGGVLGYTACGMGRSACGERGRACRMLSLTVKGGHDGVHAAIRLEERDALRSCQLIGDRGRLAIASR